MTSKDKRAARAWLVAVMAAIGLWILMTGGPALAKKNTTPGWTSPEYLKEVQEKCAY